MGAQGLIATGVPPQPLWLLYIKIAILVLSLIVLALAAYALSIAPYGAGGMDIFVAIWSFLVYGTAVALEIWAPQYFYRIAALVGYILSVIFWLTAWAYSASGASVFLNSWWIGHDGLGGALAACAGLGAIAWILNIVNLVFFVRACIIDPAGSGQAELGQVKVEGAAPQPQQFQQPQPYPAQQQYPVQQPYPQQPYPQQPYPQQQPYPPQ